MNPLIATVRAAGEGEKLWFCGGGVHTWLATAAETGGAYFLFSDELVGGKVTPLHRHPTADETFYLLEGEIMLHIDGEQRKLSAGGIAIVPRGIPHAFMVTSAEARMLCLMTPGDGEEFFRLASDPVGEGPHVVDFDRVLAAAKQTGTMELLGPPPFAA